LVRDLTKAVLPQNADAGRGIIICAGIKLAQLIG
jgi:hypothetical protein